MLLFFHSVPLGTQSVVVPSWHTDFHSKGTAMKISLLSDLASSTWVVTVESTVLLKGSDRKSVCTSCRQAQHSPVPATRVKLCLQLETALSKKWTATTVTTIWSFWPAFASMSASVRVILWFRFTSGSIWYQYLSSNQGTASHEGNFSSHNWNSTDFQVT